MPSSDRNFSDQQTRKILKKAAELQRKRGTPESATGLTLEEIQLIAEESGIDPSYVREAMLAVEEADDTNGGGFWGGPSILEYERTFKGEVPAALLEERFVPLIREELGILGKFERLGNTLTITHDEAKDSVAHRVTIVSQNGETLVRVKPRMWDWRLVYFLLPNILFGFFSLVVTNMNDLSAGFGWSLFGIMAVLVMIFGRMGYRNFTRKQRTNIKRMLGEMANVAKEYAPAEAPAEPETHQAPVAPRITLDDGAYDPEAGTPTGQRNKSSA